MPYTYFGEAAGARIIRYGVGVTQIGDAYQLEVEPWDLTEQGEFGEVVCRALLVLVRHEAGYQIDVTPILDDVELPVQSFSAPAPSVAGGAVVQLYVPVNKRATSVRARVETTALFGETEIVDVQQSSIPVRPTR